MCTSSGSSWSVKHVTEPPNPHLPPTLAPPWPMTTCPPQSLQPLWPCLSCRCGSADSSTCWWRCCTATRHCSWTYWRTAVISLSLWTGWGFTLQGQGLLGPVAWPPLSSPSSPWSTPGSNSSHEPRYSEVVHLRGHKEDWDHSLMGKHTVKMAHSGIAARHPDPTIWQVASMRTTVTPRRFFHTA